MIDSTRIGAPPRPGADEPGEPLPRYQIDTSWFGENNLSFDDIVRARICEMDRARVGQEVEERVPLFDKSTGRPRFENRKSVFGDDPLKVIADHCGRAKNYVTRDMPTLEAVFRVLLANGNEPMTLDEVRMNLAEWCPGGGCQWLLMPLEMMDRLVKNDRYYGLRQVVEGT